jgi:hypothetical protein
MKMANNIGNYQVVILEYLLSLKTILLIKKLINKAINRVNIKNFSRFIIY